MVVRRRPDKDRLPRSQLHRDSSKYFTYIMTARTLLQLPWTLRDAPESIMQHFKCSICMDVLKDPVTSTCGHTFCMHCLNHHMSNTNPLCPLCKSHLPELKVNIVLKDIIKEFQRPRTPSPDEFTGQLGEVPCDVCNEGPKYKAVKTCLICLLSFCKKHLNGHRKMPKGHKLVVPLNGIDKWACMVHNRPLELYSVNENKLICSLCVQEGTQLVSVEKERDKKKAEMHTVVSEIKQRIQKREENIKELDNSVANCLSYPSTTILANDDDWTSVSLDTDLRFSTLKNTEVAMIAEIRNEFEKLSRLEIARIKKFGVDVTLDPDTSHSQLLISEDMRQVQNSVEKRDASDCPERFDMFGSILGKNRLTESRAFWIVEVGNKNGWDIGVAREEANRKGVLCLKPSQGYWAIVLCDGDNYAALEDTPVLLSLSTAPCKVGVFVDYSERFVSFYDMEAETHIYSFTDCAFTSVIRPYFSPHFNQEDPLVICPVNMNE